MKLSEKLTSMILKASTAQVLAFCAFVPSHAQGIYALKQVNTPYDEQQPVISSKEELFVTVAFHPQNTGGGKDYGDVWYSKKNEFNQWQEAKPVKSLSTSGYDLLIGFPDDNTALVYHDGKQKPHGIHLYRRTGETDWQYVSQLDFGSFKNNGNSFSARLHPSGDVLVMAMDTYGTYGNEDIYVSFKQSGNKWSVPKNIGPAVNTFEQEMTPFLSNDKQVLYFSTNGHGTGEGRDIFYTQRLDDSWEHWSTPKRLNEDINSRGVELSYFIDPNSPYTAFVTTTQDSEGYGDILMRRKEEIVLDEVAPMDDEPFLAANFPAGNARNKVASTAGTESIVLLPPPDPLAEEETVKVMEVETVNTGTPETTVSEIQPAAPVEKAVPEAVQEEAPLAQSTPSKIEAPETTTKISFSVLDKSTRAEIPYKLSFMDAQGEKIGQESGLEGVNEVALREGAAKVVISSENFLPESISLDGLKPDNLIMLTPAKSGTSLVLKDVLFKRGTSELADERSTTNINQLVDFMNENPSVKIRLDGHTDNLGNAALNKQLSMERAGTIRDYMVQKGVAFERIRVRGLGGSQPVSNNDTEAGREQNRRVEMVIID